MAELPEYIKSMSVDECRKEAARLASERPQFPGKDWLNKLKSRIADGENVPFRSRQIVEEMSRHEREEVPAETVEGIEECPEATE
jgi:hypothetical protein